MIDPIGSFDSIKDHFLRYIKTAFGIRFDTESRERDDLLNRDGVFFRQPWVEPLPEYQSSNVKVAKLAAEHLPDLPERALAIFKELVGKGLFKGDYPMHQHQLEMLQQAVAGDHCVITSGTGSGKTESFLLPLFAQLAKEMEKWPAGQQRPHRAWWNEDNTATAAKAIGNDFLMKDAFRQRCTENRPAAVRALVLYPMNALVEDQMSRLRRALDSDDVREWMQENHPGHRLYFGRYNGSTPVPGTFRKADGTRNDAKFKELKKALKGLDAQARDVEEYIAAQNKTVDEADKLRSFFPRLDGAEMRSRADMQLAPPDILITNFSMLSIMLMRKVDEGILEKTRAWLAGEDLAEEQRAEACKDRIFHLIIDELHLYRGSAGSEVAYLIRLLLHRLGLNPQHPQLRILASSASLDPEDAKSKMFLQDFFGVPGDVFNPEAPRKFRIIKGTEKPVEGLAEAAGYLPTEPFIRIAEAFDKCTRNVSDTGLHRTVEEQVRTLATALQVPPPAEGLDHALGFLAKEINLRERLYKACQWQQGNEAHYRACRSLRGKGDPGNDDTQGPVFAEHLFGVERAHEQLHGALRGLLIARGMLDEHKIKHDLPRFRFHYFFRNIEGLWASVDSADVEEDYSAENRKVGKLYASPRLLSEKGKRVLDLLYCERCETLLLGGMRSKGRNDNWELLSANNALDQAPHRSPNLLVQDRSHQEYAVFWPQGEQPFVPRTNQQGNEAPEWTNQTTTGGLAHYGTAAWVEARINVQTGEISFNMEDVPKGWAKGMLFRIVDEHNADLARRVSPTHKALPCVCPACGGDYSKRRYKKTPIRSFRTGFGKSAELFATELIHQLGTDPSKRKLVAFSDSRDDAARLANAVEREHYEDLVRELLADVGRNVLEKQAALLITVNRAPEYRQQEGDSQAVIDALDLLRVQHHARFGAEAKRELSRMRAGLVKVSDLLKGEGHRLGALAERMAELGINPGGSDINSRRIWQGNALHHWHNLLRKQDGAWQWTNDAGGLIDHGNTALQRQVAQTFFGRLFYTAEAAGIGYLCIDPNDPDMQVAIDRYKPDGITKEVFVDILNATVRLLGDRYQYPGGEFDPIQAANYDHWPAPIRKWVQNTAAHNGIRGAVLGPAIFMALVAEVAGAARGVYSGGSGLFIDRLCFKPSTPDQPIWRNARSQRVYLQAGGGVCTQEGSRLNLRADGTVDPGVLLTEAHNGALSQQQAKHYLGHRAMVEQRQPARLRCEELTGQTDDQFERQRHFRDIVLEREGPPKMRQIDLLSVTTTLEVGVDIGDLLAVMQANMPPQRFNYQQRVGRAGRRGQAYSAVLTYCRGRSHDEHYFQHPERITGEPPPTPFLSMDQGKILKRLLAKEVLRRVFKDVEQEVARIDEDEDGNGEADGLEPGQEFFRSNVHGEFGPVSIWTPNRKDSVRAWINDHEQDVNAILNGLLSGISEELAAKRRSLKEWLTTGLLDEMDSAANDPNLSSSDLSQRLAEAGILPMFGMPTSVRNLYHGVGGTLQEPSLLAIDRAEGMAVNEFAPGAQKTKDKTIHTAIGFTAPLAIGRRRNVTHLLPDDQHPFALHKWLVKCKACGKTDLRNPERDEHDDEVIITEDFSVDCSSCQTPVKPIALRSPRAYRTDLSKGTDAAEDIPLNLSRPPVLAITNAATSSTNGPNYVNELVRDAQTWRVNDNGERLFRGRMCTTRNETPLTAQSDISHQWIWEDAPGMDADGYNFSIRQSGPIESIAIAAQKHTELVKLAHRTTPAGLTLDPFPSDGGNSANARSHAIRAAYYSAAFLLQRILADELDVDPSEIEVADLAPRTLTDEMRVADIILADELPNGSGFVRELHTRLEKLLPQALDSSDPVKFMKAVFSEAHRTSCLDSCYDCLRVYRNMNYHGLLDWRLGLSLLRLMQESAHRAGADGMFTAPELADWSTLANAQAERIAGNFEGIMHAVIAVDGISVPVLRTHRRHFLIIHPFWNVESPGKKTWLDQVVRKATEEANGTELRWVDTFNLYRRIGWCYANILSA